jgi:hypothetical protein
MVCKEEAEEEDVEEGVCEGLRVALLLGDEEEEAAER